MYFSFRTDGKEIIKLVCSRNGQIRKWVTNHSRTIMKINWDSSVKGSRGILGGCKEEPLPLWFDLQNPGIHFANSTKYYTNISTVRSICHCSCFHRAHSLEMGTQRGKSTRWLGLQDVYDSIWVECTLEAGAWGKKSWHIKCSGIYIFEKIIQKGINVQLSSGNKKVRDSDVPERLRALQKNHHSIPGLST